MQIAAEKETTEEGKAKRGKSKEEKSKKGIDKKPPPMTLARESRPDGMEKKGLKGVGVRFSGCCSRRHAHSARQSR